MINSMKIRQEKPDYYPQVYELVKKSFATASVLIKKRIRKVANYVKKYV